MLHAEKTLILLAKDTESTRLIYLGLVKAGFRFQKIVLEDPQDKVDLIKKRVKKLGYGTVAGQLLFQLLMLPMLKMAARKRKATIFESAGLFPLPLPENLVVRVKTVNSPDARAIIGQSKPDLVLINGTRILSKETLASSPAPFLNTHAGITPLYRGVHGGYWALSNNDPANCGTTVHFVDRGIDTGGIVAQKNIHPERGDNFSTYPTLQTLIGIDLLASAIPRVLGGSTQTIPAPEGKSRLWTHPTIFQYLKNRLFFGIR